MPPAQLLRRALPKRVAYTDVRKSGLGPVAWCKTCSRFHPRREVCQLYLRQRVAKSGRKVTRWCH